MGKRITSQARGHGSLVFRVRKKAYRYKIKYPSAINGKTRIIKLLHSAAHSSPLIKLQIQDNHIVFYNLAFNKAFEGQEINLNEKEVRAGDIAMLKDIEPGTKVYNIENQPGDGGKFIRSAGSSAQITKKEKGSVRLLMPSKKTKEFDERCRATIGVPAGSGRLDKPVMKAGNRFHAMKAKGRKWHRTSAVKVNAVDHPFGGGSGKRIKSKIAKRNAPPGRKVGHIRPSRTGRKKR